MDNLLTEQHYITAERICRREFEKRFDLDLTLPIGHPKNILFGTNEQLIEALTEQMKFWKELSSRYVKSSSNNLEELLNTKTHPLKEAVFFICEVQIGGCLKRIIELKS